METENETKGVCKKHGVAKLLYARGLGNGTVYLCPVCVAIKANKLGIKETKEKSKKFKQQLVEFKRKLESDKLENFKHVLRMRANIVELNSNPKTCFDHEVESRRKWKAEIAGRKEELK